MDGMESYGVHGQRSAAGQQHDADAAQSLASDWRSGPWHSRSRATMVQEVQQQRDAGAATPRRGQRFDMRRRARRRRVSSARNSHVMSTHVVVLIEVRPPSWPWPRKATLSSGKGRASCGSAKTASSMAAKRLLNRGEARPLSSRRAEVARRRVTWRLGAMEACARLANNAALRGAWRVAAKAVHTVTTRPSNSSLALRMSGNKAINFNACGQTGPQGSKATRSTILPLTSHSVQSSHDDSHSSSLVLRTQQLSCHGGVIAPTGDTPTRSESIKMYVDKKLRPTLTSEAAHLAHSG